MERRFKALILLFVIATVFLFSKIFYLSIAREEQYEKAVLTQQEGMLNAGSVRGGIFDRNLIPLTERQTSVWHITDEARLVRGEGEAAFILPKRSNPSGLCSHLVGYTTPDGKGICGIEKKYDEALSSDISYTVCYTKNARGGPVKGKEIKTLPTDDKNQKGISLTIDYHIQKAAEEVMDKWVPKGAVVVLDTESFELLAMASRPNYDAENIASLLNSDKGELLNRALCAYNAGSVFKTITAAAALDGNTSYALKEFNCAGIFEHGEKTFMCHKKEGHGKVSFFKAFADSCNCAFYETALHLGGKKITDTAKKFGLGEKIFYMGSEEAAGFIPKSKEYTPFDVINIGIGQGEILITPLQSAVVVATVANKGVRKEVSVAKQIVDEKGEFLTTLKNTKSIRAIKEPTAQILGNMMRECVLTGTAKSIAASPLEIAGKTGSAETGWLRDDGTPMVHGWFCGFFPYSSPKYAIAVLCEDGKSGAESCVEPFLELCEKIVKIYPLKQ